MPGRAHAGGDKCTAQRVLADVVGPSLRCTTARIAKATTSSAGNAQDEVGQAD